MHTQAAEITLMRRDIRAQERGMLQRADVSTASAEQLLSRMRTKLKDLCREREVHKAQPPQLGQARSEGIRQPSHSALIPRFPSLAYKGRGEYRARRALPCPAFSA